MKAQTRASSLIHEQMIVSARDSKRVLHSGHTIAGNGAIKHRIGLRGGPLWHCESRVRTFVGEQKFDG